MNQWKELKITVISLTEYKIYQKPGLISANSSTCMTVLLIRNIVKIIVWSTKQTNRLM